MATRGRGRGNLLHISVNQSGTCISYFREQSNTFTPPTLIPVVKQSHCAHPPLSLFNHEGRILKHHLAVARFWNYRREGSLYTRPCPSFPCFSCTMSTLISGRSLLMYFQAFFFSFFLGGGICVTHRNAFGAVCGTPARLAGGP